MRPHFASETILACGALIAACTTEPVVAPRAAPSFSFAAAAAGPNNVLSGVVSLRLHHADSVAVRFHLEGAQGLDSVTPAVRTNGDTALSVPVLGLLPDRRYILQPVAYGGDQTLIGEALELVTQKLPSDLPSYVAAGTNAMAGYVVLAVGMYGLVIDNTGRVVWYRRFANGPWLNFMAQPNGRYVVRNVTADPTDVESWVELDALGNITRTFGCGLGLQPRFHDLISETDGGYWILCDETRTMDLAALGGSANARVTGTAIQHLSGKGELLFHWSPFDHFLITDVDSTERSGTSVNWTHGNSLDIDADGNLLVSFRNLNEVTKIDSHTGSVMWRLGGRRNQFTFVDGVRSFGGQHSIRAYAPGKVVLMDNVGDPIESRAERWAVDAAGGTARLLQSYGSAPKVRTLIGGSVQSLASDRTLVSFGTEGRVEEYDAAGNVVWRIESAPGYVFRAQRIRSLYRPGVETPR